jgi:hypothetical protein
MVSFVVTRRGVIMLLVGFMTWGDEKKMRDLQGSNFVLLPSLFLYTALPISAAAAHLTDIQPLSFAVAFSYPLMYYIETHEFQNSFPNDALVLAPKQSEERMSSKYFWVLKCRSKGTLKKVV